MYWSQTKALFPTKPMSVKDINGETSESMILMIDGEEYPVEWEDNESVEALKELCPLTLDEIREFGRRL